MVEVKEVSIITSQVVFTLEYCSLEIELVDPDGYDVDLSRVKRLRVVDGEIIAESDSESFVLFEGSDDDCKNLSFGVGVGIKEWRGYAESTSYGRGNW